MTPSFKPLQGALLAALLASAVVQSVYAQDNKDEKRALAERIVKAQQGAEVDRMSTGLAQRAAGGIVQEAAMVLERQVPQASREAARKQMNEAMDAYVKDTSAVIKGKMPSALSQSVVPIYVEKFSLDELKQMATFFESDASKKYQQVTPELGQAMMQGIIKETEAQVNPKLQAFAGKLEEILVKNGAKKPNSKPAPKSGGAGVPGSSPKNPLKPPATTPEGAPVPRPGASN